MNTSDVIPPTQLDGPWPHNTDNLSIFFEVLDYNVKASHQYGFSHELKDHFSLQKPCRSDCNCKVSSQCEFSNELKENLSVQKICCNNCNYKASPQYGFLCDLQEHCFVQNLCVSDCNCMVAFQCVLSHVL